MAHRRFARAGGDPERLDHGRRRTAKRTLEAAGDIPDLTTPASQGQSVHADQHEEADARELLRLALEVAARNGDPDPVLIEHAYGTRFDVTRTTGSIVYDGTPSCIFVMQGNFRWNHSRPANPVGPEVRSFPFQIVVIDVRSREVTDLGAHVQRPDLTSLGRVVRDRPT